MNTDIFFKETFYFGLALYLIPLIVAYWEKRMRRVVKFFLIAVLAFLFSTQQAFQASSLLSEDKRSNLMKGLLPTVDAIKVLAPNSRIRANVFLLDKLKEIYYIEYQYNMNNSDEKNMRIPVHMGCTGDAWRTAQQKWCDQTTIFKEGSHRVPEEWLKLVPSDLKWIISTPIQIKGEVRAVLNIDGNVPLSAAQKEFVSQQARNLAESISGVLFS